MKHEILAQAMNEISDAHLAQAAKRKRRPWLGAVAALLALAVGLGLLHPGTQSATAGKYPVFSWIYREGMYDTVSDLQQFWGDTMRNALSDTQENAVFSPANLYLSLSLAAELTQGQTQQELLQLLGSEDIASHRTTAKEFWHACYYDDKDKTILANSLWLQNGPAYNRDTIDLLANHYYTSVYQQDLGSSKTTADIQKWINEQTDNLLSDAVEKIELPDNALMALYSTVYYRAKWQQGSDFHPDNNKEGIFHSPTGDVSCTFMRKQQHVTDYYWGESYSAVALHLKDGSYMWFILPDEDKTTDTVLQDRSLWQLLFFRDKVESKRLKVNLSVPKFDIQQSSDLRESLEDLGVTEIFTPGMADFSPILTDSPLWLTGIKQATRVAIDEEGATAASYIEMPMAGAASPPDEIVDFVLDRPFLFVISNRYNTPLFSGVVNLP